MGECKLTCSYCGATLRDTTICPDCQEDLSALAKLQYGHYIYYNQAVALARQREFDQARTKLLLALEMNKSFVPGYALLAKVSAVQGRWAEAKANAARALELAPDDANLRRLASDIEEAEQEALRERQEQERIAAQARRANAERYLAKHQRELAYAFGIGAGLAGMVAFVLSRLHGKDS